MQLPLSQWNHTSDALGKSENTNTKCLLVRLPQYLFYCVFKFKSPKSLAIKYDFLPSSKLWLVIDCFLFIFSKMSK